MKNRKLIHLMEGISFIFLWAFSLAMSAQNINVSGTVNDLNGDPL